MVFLRRTFTPCAKTLAEPVPHIKTCLTARLRLRLAVKRKYRLSRQPRHGVTGHIELLSVTMSMSAQVEFAGGWLRRR